MEEVNFNRIKQQCTDIAEIIDKNQDKLKAILIQYQPHNVAQYEINRCMCTLKSIDDNRQHFKNKVDIISVFMPSNLPLYSFIIFALIPAFIADHLYLHSNITVQDILTKLYYVLEIKEHFPNINIICKDHDAFIEKYVKKSKVIIFTGRGTTKAEIEKVMPNNSILIFNGSGHNPVVVTDNAQIDKAVKDTIFVKFFNSGQDCAGPDSILVHTKIVHQFISKFKKECSQLIIDELSNHNTFIGPIHKGSELVRLKQIIDDNKDNIIYGGQIDYDKKIVSPTIISLKIKEKANFKETFGPIAFVIEYDKDEELKLYFQDRDGKYQYNKMYVSLYGNSKYIESNCDLSLLERVGSTKKGIGIVLNNQTIHDTEIGTKAYGGYSKGASAVLYKDLDGKMFKKALPILIPEIITKLLIDKKTVDNLSI